jgi:hypothetical protein
MGVVVLGVAAVTVIRRRTTCRDPLSAEPGNADNERIRRELGHDGYLGFPRTA